MRKKMFKLTGALLILAGGLVVTLTPKNVEAETCRQLLLECSAACGGDQACGQDCQCQFLNCKGMQCN